MNAPSKIPWKRIAALTAWLCLVPPVGLWKLWEDRQLAPSTKWRILVYLFVIPATLYATYSLWSANKTFDRYLP